jgi:hypothetical protein
MVHFHSKLSDIVDIDELRNVIADDLLDHVLNPMCCKCTRQDHGSPRNGDYGIKEFARQRAAAELPLPTSVTCNHDNVYKPPSEKPATLPPSSMSDWEQVYQRLRTLFTGDQPGTRELDSIDTSNAPEGIEELKAFIRAQQLKFELMKDKLKLNPAIDDLLTSDNPEDIKAAEGNTTCDIDSVVAFLDDLSAINADMKFEVNPSQITNLRDSVHLHYKGKAVHKHTNCLLATFGAFIKFSLYLIAPKLPTKQRPKKGEIANAMPIDVLQSLMDDCLLPAIKLIIPATQRTSFPELWIEVKDKARVPWIENKKTKQQQTREQHIGYGPTTTIRFRNSEPDGLHHVERL